MKLIAFKLHRHSYYMSNDDTLHVNPDNVSEVIAGWDDTLQKECAIIRTGDRGYWVEDGVKEVLEKLS